MRSLQSQAVGNGSRIFSMFAHVAVGRRSQFPAMWVSSWDFSGSVSCFAPEEVIQGSERLRQKLQCLLETNLRSGIALLLRYSVGHTD